MTDRLTPGQLRDLAAVVDYDHPYLSSPNTTRKPYGELANAIRDEAARREAEERAANRRGEGSDPERTAADDALLFKGVDAPPPPAPVRPCDDPGLALDLGNVIAAAHDARGRRINEVLDDTSITNIMLQITEGSSILDDLIARHTEALRAERDARHSAMLTAREAANQFLARAEAAEAEAKKSRNEAIKATSCAFHDAELRVAAEADAKRLRDIVEKVTLAVCDTPVGSTSAEVKKRVLAAFAQGGSDG